MRTKNYDPVLTRLLLIIKKLCNDERPTIKELAEEFNVSIRTIQTDIYKRIPLVAFVEKDQFGRLKFIDGYSFCDLDLKDVA